MPRVTPCSIAAPAASVGDGKPIARNHGRRAARSTRDAFLAATAFERRNPLTPILRHLEMMQATVRRGRLSTQEIGQKLDGLAILIEHYSRCGVERGVAELPDDTITVFIRDYDQDFSAENRARSFAGFDDVVGIGDGGTRVCVSPPRHADR